MIKAVLFDYGGVLSECGKAGTIRSIFAKVYGVNANKLRLEEAGMLAIKGLISDQEFVDRMNQKHSTSGRVDNTHLQVAADELCTPSEQVYELATDLRKKGIKTAIVSNTLRVSADTIKARGLYDDFDPLILSCDVQAAKPENQFYQLALDRLGIESGQALLVDDQDKFLKPAAAMGMHTILAKSPDQIVKDVKDLVSKQNGIQL